MKKLLAIVLAAFLIFSPVGFCTVSSATHSVYYTGDNLTTQYSFAFPVYLTSDIKVQVTPYPIWVSGHTYVAGDKVLYQSSTYNCLVGHTASTSFATDYASGDWVAYTIPPTTLALGVDYSATLTSTAPSAGHINLLPGGSYPTIPTNYTLAIIRNVPFTQLISLQDNSVTPAKTYNEAFDRAVMLAQQAYDYATNLVGPPGPAGATGATGAAGATGQQGATGATGPAGPVGAGSGDVLGPATNTDLYVPRWAGANTKTLGNGVAIGVSANNLVQFTSSAKFPAVDGSLITSVTGANVSAIPDSSLNQITTASKVSGAAIGLLTSVPAGANRLPRANTPLINTDTPVALADGAGSVIDSTLGNTFTMTATGDRTLGTTTGGVNGQKIVIVFTASGGARTLTLPTATDGDFAYGTDISSLSATSSGKADVIGCIYDSTAKRYRVVAYVKGY